MVIWHHKNREKIHSKLKTTVLLYYCLSTGKFYRKLFCRESGRYWIRKSLRPSMLYMTRKLTKDVVLGHKNLISGAKKKAMVKSCLGIDLSEAFDTVDRCKVLGKFKKKRNWAKNISLIKCILNVTNLQIKRGKQKKGVFRTT